MQLSRYGLIRAEEKEKHLSRPAGHTAFDAGQDVVGLLGCKCTLLAHVQHLMSSFSPTGISKSFSAGPLPVASSPSL